MSSMAIRIISPVFTGEVPADDNATEPQTVPKRIMVNINAGIQDRNADPIPVQARSR